MNETDLCYMPAIELADAIRAKNLSAVEITSAVLNRIKRLEPKLNAFAYVAAEEAMDAAQAADRRLAKGDPIGPLHGVPVTIKDHEAVRGMLSHHMVIRDGKIANYHPYPPTPWNASPRDIHGTPGPYEDAVQGTPIFEENGPDDFKGIDIMRVVRSFDPCMPCGVHMYLGNGKSLETRHSPMFGLVEKQ